MGELPPHNKANVPPGVNTLRPETRLTNIIQRIDTGLARVKGVDGEKGLGKRIGYCNLTTSLVAHVASAEGATAENYQLHDVHQAAGQLDKSNIFQHAFTIVSFDAGQRKFLVDMSYMQFMKPDGRIIEGTMDTGLKIDNQLAQRLLDDQFVELTDETFRQYLEITTANRTAQYIS